MKPLRIAGSQIFGSGHQTYQAERIPAVQGQVHDPLLIHQAAHLIGGALDQRGIARHPDLFRKSSQRKLRVHARVTVQGKLYPIEEGRLESFELDSNCIHAKREVRKAVVAHLVCRGAPDFVRQRVRRLNPGSSHNSSGFVRHGPENGCCGLSRYDRASPAQEKHAEQNGAADRA